MSQIPTLSRPARLDRLCAEAVELARAAAEETGEGVGEYLHAEPESDRVVTHFFESTLAGYRGWRWAVVVARAPRSRTVTVNETALLPGPDALRAPEWVPWAERLQAGDVGVGDLLPTDESDARLMPAYELSDDDAVEDIAYELGVGRTRVMSREGRIDCAERWYDGEHGPSAEISTSAPPEARCGGCGFYLPLAGSLRQLFGVCGNMYAADDASVVSADHGCGAHSEVLAQLEAEHPHEDESSEPVYDDALIEQIDTAAEDEAEEPVAEVVPDEPVAEATPETDEEPTAEPEPKAEVEEPVDTEAATAEEPVAEVVADAPAEVAVVESDTPEAVEVDVDVTPEAAVEVDVTVPRAETAEVTVTEEPQAPSEVAASEPVVASESDTPEPVAESTAPESADTDSTRD